jgi:DNA invertase Pin-like site-specific DNA recombinase
MMKKKYSTRLLEAIRTPAKASNYIAHVDHLQPCRVVVLCRVSIPCNKGHLDDQDSNLSWEFERMGFDIVGVFKEVASGDAEDRITLELAALKAKELGAVLVAESTNRFVRSFCYKREDILREVEKPRRIAISPNVMDFERFLDLVHGAKLATLWHPDLSEKEIRKLQSKRGQKGHRGGRPAVPLTNKRRRELKASLAVKLRQDGLSWRQIGKALNVPWRTSKDWVVKMLSNPHTIRQ